MVQVNKPLIRSHGGFSLSWIIEYSQYLGNWFTCSFSVQFILLQFILQVKIFTIVNIRSNVVRRFI